MGLAKADRVHLETVDGVEMTLHVLNIDTSEPLMAIYLGYSLSSQWPLNTTGINVVNYVCGLPDDEQGLWMTVHHRDGVSYQNWRLKKVYEGALVKFLKVWGYPLPGLRQF